MAPQFDITADKRATQRAFFKRQLFVTPQAITGREVDAAGKTAIVTGANTGLGLEVARQLLDIGITRLILAVRNEVKGNAAKKDLLAGRSSDQQTVEVWQLDVANYNSITAFAARARSLERLDILVNNAGITKPTFELVEGTGHEQVIQVNYISLVLITVLFLPIIKDKSEPGKPGRIVLVNSDVASWAKFKERKSTPILAALDQKSSFEFQDRYSTSKLLGQLFLSELAKRVPSGVAIVNAPNPGLVKTGLQQDFNGTAVGFVFGIFKAIFARTPAVGARSIVDAAVNHSQESHGQYVEDGKIQPMAPLVYTPEGNRIAQQLWQETLEDLAPFRLAEIIATLNTA